MTNWVWFAGLEEVTLWMSSAGWVVEAVVVKVLEQGRTAFSGVAAVVVLVGG
jgi:hypothetical protein